MSADGSDYKIVGKRAPRIDAGERVSGRAIYPADLVRPGLVHGSILRSPHAHARIVSIDVSRAATMKGVLAVVAAADFPDVPTIDESGLKGFEIGTWFGILAPAGTPKEVVDKLYTETSKALNSPEMKAIWLQNGSEIPQFTPDQFAQFQHAEIKRWADVVQRSGAKID